MKLPAFQFYPADWRKDSGVRALSFHDRGIWFEILCIMHESEKRGKLVLNGKVMPVESIAQIVGISAQELQQSLDRILEVGVCSVDKNTGAIMCRRMVRDEKLRNVRRRSGSLGGNPNLVNQKYNQKSTTHVKQKPTPSSSSSSSSLDKSTPRPSLEEVKLTCAKGGVLEKDGEWFFHKCEGNGWTNGGKPIKRWWSTIKAWQTAGYLPSQKQPQQQPESPKESYQW